MTSLFITIFHDISLIKDSFFYVFENYFENQKITVIKYKLEQIFY